MLAGRAPTARPDVLGGIAALGAISLLPGSAAIAAPKPRRIDVHHHLAPPSYMAAIPRNLAPAALIEGSLTEIRYALDTLKADGIAMWTNCGDRWLGHPSFAPVFEELNRRKVTVFTPNRQIACRCWR